MQGAGVGCDHDVAAFHDAAEAGQPQLAAIGCADPGIHLERRGRQRFFAWSKPDDDPYTPRREASRKLREAIAGPALERGEG
jgi:hypothetical protein